MQHRKSTFLALASLVATSLGAIAATDTPAYVDLEFSQFRVNEPAGTVAINIIRSGDFRQTTTIEYQTVEGDASEGQDYKGVGGSIVFRPGEGFKTVTVTILSDGQEESSESFRFELTTSDPNAQLMRSAAVVTIEDAPAAVSQPQLQIAAAPGGNVLLSWEGPHQCSLERSTNPALGQWEAVACIPTVNGEKSEVTQPVGNTFFFYRLRTE
jgi:hypothetical protein